MKKSSLTAMLALTVAYFILTLALLCLRHNGNEFSFRPDRLSQLQSTETCHSIDTSPSSISSKINVNTATAEELSLLPGIGEVIAQRIIEFRQNEGKFYSASDLLKVKGIGEKRLEQILNYITTGG